MQVWDSAPSLARDNLMTQESGVTNARGICDTRGDRVSLKLVLFFWEGSCPSTSQPALPPLWQAVIFKCQTSARCLSAVHGGHLPSLDQALQQLPLLLLQPMGRGTVLEEGLVAYHRTHTFPIPGP